MRDTGLGQFLCPDGFARPALLALTHESRVVGEAGLYAATALGRRRRGRATPYVGQVAPRASEPVVLIPGFMAGDYSLRLMSTELRRRGYRTYRSEINANVGCTLEAVERLERRLEAIVARRGSRVQLVGHSLGGMLARGIAARRPDLVSGVVTMGSPMLAPGAHHRLLSGGVDVLVRLSRAGLRGLMTQDCVGGECARRSFEDCQAPLASDVALTCLYSRRDGAVDWKACIDPASTAVEVRSSHLGMAVDPRVVTEVVAALARHASVVQPGPRVASLSALEVDAGVGA